MPDRETVIYGLEEFKADFKPYVGNHADWEKIDNALSLLKAQEPEKVEIKDSDGGTTHWYVCGACKAPINIGDKFCRECGKKVGWE